jgi:hypothetical protein
MSDQEWDYGALAIEVSAAKAEIERLKALLTGAAEMLETLGCKGPAVAELRKAAAE